VLEEPPPKAVLLIVSHAPGRLLPTIRSRCRRLALQPLAEDDVVRLLGDYAPESPAAERPALARLSDGSIGRALELAAAGSLALYREMIAVLSTLPDLDMVRLHGFAERFARRGEEANADWRSLTYVLDRWFKAFARRASDELAPAEVDLASRMRDAASLDRWIEAWEKVAHLLSRADAVNLDRKQTVLVSFLALQSAMR
jgi:DNA polymerase-3 subunit delta'